MPIDGRCKVCGPVPCVCHSHLNTTVPISLKCGDTYRSPSQQALTSFRLARADESSFFPFGLGTPRSVLVASLSRREGTIRQTLRSSGPRRDSTSPNGQGASLSERVCSQPAISKIIPERTPVLLLYFRIVGLKKSSSMKRDERRASISSTLKSTHVRYLHRKSKSLFTQSETIIKNFIYEI